MSSTDIDVKYVAHLARLQLSHEEEAKFGSQLGQVLGAIGVSGNTPQEDEDIAKVGAAAIARPLASTGGGQ